MDPNDMPHGGPAFPTENGQQVGPSSYHFEGMSLRDYFAAHASDIDVDVAIIESPVLCRMANVTERFALARYAVADAMLKARQS